MELEIITTLIVVSVAAAINNRHLVTSEVTGKNRD
jgi:hypothetical protein